MATEPKVVHATVRHAAISETESELHIECRFDDGQKFAAIRVDEGFDDLAMRIAEFLNREARQSEACLEYELLPGRS